jgi:hypothetical protein
LAPGPSGPRGARPLRLVARGQDGLREQGRLVAVGDGAALSDRTPVVGRLYIEDDEVAGIELGEVIPDLLDRDYVGQLVREASNPDASPDGRGSSK